MTAEDLLNVPNKRTELVRGRLVVHEPPGGKHGHVTANLGARLWTHADLTRAGAVFVGDWLDAGARLVWVVDPERRVARVYRQDGTEDVISGDGALLGEDVLPGFSCTLTTVL